jgi:hypothetical protein
MSDRELIAEGEEARDKGIKKAINGRSLPILTGQVAMLEALLKSKKPLSIDAIAGHDELRTKYEDKGCWRGAICLGLSKAGIIATTSYAKSLRPSSHRSTRACWSIADHKQAKKYLEMARGRIAEYEKSPTPAATDVGQIVDAPKTKLGESING